MFNTNLTGPKEVPAHKVDTYLRPLVRDLQKLWEPGVQVHMNGERVMIRAMLIWFMHDYPGEMYTVNNP